MTGPSKAQRKVLERMVRDTDNVIHYHPFDGFPAFACFAGDFLNSIHLNTFWSLEKRKWIECTGKIKKGFREGCPDNRYRITPAGREAIK